MDAASPNAAQIEAWNTAAGPTWVKFQAQLDHQLAPLGERVADALRPEAGERVLDVGCGAGATTLDLARCVGPEGAVVGLDVSEPLLETARARSPGPGAAPITFLNADAQTARFERVFDVIFSRFGVMFFDDFEAAFTNLHRAARPGGRFGFVCWRAIEDNPWMTLPAKAAAEVIAPSPPAPPGAPGPFALADEGRLDGLLAATGWRDAVLEPLDLAVGGADLDATARLMTRVGPLGMALREAGSIPDMIAAAEDKVREAIRPYQRADGVFVPAAVWIVTARA